jgi:hypothetical protein
VVWWSGGLVVWWSGGLVDGSKIENGRFGSLLKIRTLTFRVNCCKFTRMEFHGNLIPPPDNAAELIAERVAAGETTKHLAKRFGVSYTTMVRWVSDSSRFPDLNQAWIIGKQAHAHALAEGLLDTAGSPLHDNPKLANAEVQRRRLMVSTAQWISSKLLRRVYGDRATVDHNHTGEVKVSPLAQLRKLEGGGGKPVIDVSDETTEDDCF